MWLMLVCCRDLQYITECQIQALANLQLKIDIYPPPSAPSKEWKIWWFVFAILRQSELKLKVSLLASQTPRVLDFTRDQIVF